MSTATEPLHTPLIAYGVLRAEAMSPLKSVWKSALAQLSVMGEASDDPEVREEAATLADEMRKAAKPGNSHCRFAEFLTRFCKLLDIDIQRVEDESAQSHSDMQLADQEIESLESLKSAAEAWAEVYAARYPLTSND